MSDHRPSDPPDAQGQQPPRRENSASADPLELIEECLASFPEGDPRQKLLYKLRHVITAQSIVHDRRETEFKKLNDVVSKLTAPANRVGLLLEVPAEGLARIVVGGAEYYANIDPRLASVSLVAPSVRCTIYWSVHQYHRPMIGAQNSMPNHG